jgi:hypothetical protein
LTIATIAEALEATICVPPALIVVLVAVPPDTTTCEPVKTVALLASPESNCVPPLIRAPESTPPL